MSSVGTTGRSAASVAPCGALSSSTMIVIRIAITPSLKASRRCVFMNPARLDRAGCPPSLLEECDDVLREALGLVEIDEVSRPFVLDDARVRERGGECSLLRDADREVLAAGE